MGRLGLLLFLRQETFLFYDFHSVSGHSPPIYFLLPIEVGGPKLQKCYLTPFLPLMAHLACERVRDDSRTGEWGRLGNNSDIIVLIRFYWCSPSDYDVDYLQKAYAFLTVCREWCSIRHTMRMSSIREILVKIYWVTYIFLNFVLYIIIK